MVQLGVWQRVQGAAGKVKSVGGRQVDTPSRRVC